MKKYFFLFLICLLSSSSALFAEDAATQDASAPTGTNTETAAVEPASPVAAAPVAAPAVPATEAVSAPQESSAPAAAPAAASAEDAAMSENLEFVSGEVTAMDEPAKTLTVKLYGETEEALNEKTLAVHIDENTDITDGETDRDLKSLTPGTEVDVEYDATSNKATYIFVY